MSHTARGAMRGEVGERRRADRTLGREGGHRLRVHVEDDDLVARGAQAAGEARAHPAEADHSYLHGCAPSLTPRTASRGGTIQTA
jgi:hypothetical protein